MWTSSRRLIPLVQQRYTVHALDRPGIGYWQIVPGAFYQEPAMHTAVKRRSPSSTCTT